MTVHGWTVGKLAVLLAPILLVILVLAWDWLRWFWLERDYTDRIGANWGVVRRSGEGTSAFKQRILDTMVGRSRG